MSKSCEIAEYVAAQLSSYNASVMFSPVVELERGCDLKVEVIPVARTRKFASRNSREDSFSVNVGIVHKCREEGALPRLIELAETIGNAVLEMKNGSVRCTDIKWEPLYSVDELRSKGVFVSVIEATFKETGQ